jgi:hypothetical protein
VERSQQRNHTPRCAEFDRDHEKNDQHGDQGAVDDEQHHRDDEKRDGSDEVRTFVAYLEVIGEQRGGAGDVRLDPRRWRRVGHDLADAVDGTIGSRLALVAFEVDLNERCLAVLALDAARGERIAPEVLNVLDVFGICSQLLDEPVVVGMRVLAQRLIAFEHDDGSTVGVELAELLPDVLHGHDRRRIRRVQGHCTRDTDDLELGHQHVRHAGDRDPDQNDR